MNYYNSRYGNEPKNKLFLDIETLPAHEDSHETLKKIFAKKKGKDKIDFEQYLLGTSFDGSFGRILCIGYAENDDEVKVLDGSQNEAEMLQCFWDIAKDKNLFIGHNVMDFDLKFIFQRSIILGVKPPRKHRDMSFARYRNNPIYDTMHEWSKWGSGKVGLEQLAMSMGIPTPKDGIDGSQVYDFYRAGKVQEILDYCKRDVDTTREVYKKMNYENK